MWAVFGVAEVLKAYLKVKQGITVLNEDRTAALITYPTPQIRRTGGMDSPAWDPGIGGRIWKQDPVQMRAERQY